MIAVREFTSTAEMRAHAVAVHARCFGKPRRHVPVIAAAPPEQAPRKLPFWAFTCIRFDLHVFAYREHVAAESMIGAHKIKRYIRDQAMQEGSTYSEVLSQSRKRHLVKIRHQIIWEIKTHVKPEISYPELGRLMGGRDHTSCLHAFRKVEAARASA